MARAFILVMDSFGIGATADAEKYGDSGADTLGHIAKACHKGECDKQGLRQGPLHLPNLTQLGLGLAAYASTSEWPLGFDRAAIITGSYGCAAEMSFGKDTPSGHWEMAGLPVLYDWGYFPKKTPCFPKQLIDDLIVQANIPGVLGECHASGTEIIKSLGQTHIDTAKPIVYTSADSVFQIAAHEQYFGLKRLYALCAIARKLVDEYQIGRVIARPFLGDQPDNFKRTANRKDLATPPHQATLLNIVKEHGREVIGIGKIGDIYAHQGISRVIKAAGNDALFQTTLDQMDSMPDGALLMTNFVDFDSEYGHRRDTTGYAAALEAFDKRLPQFQKQLKPGDMAVITADHGCDPTWPGSDHTREHVPVLIFGPGINSKTLGRRSTFADIGQSIASHLGVPPLSYGENMF